MTTLFSRPRAQGLCSVGAAVAVGAFMGCGSPSPAVEVQVQFGPAATLSLSGPVQPTPIANVLGCDGPGQAFRVPLAALESTTVNLVAMDPATGQTRTIVNILPDTPDLSLTKCSPGSSLQSLSLCVQASNGTCPSTWVFCGGGPLFVQSGFWTCTDGYGGGFAKN